jgi:hypothetical protein
MSVHHSCANDLNLMHKFINYVLTITFGRQTCKNWNIFKHLALADNIKMDLTQIVCKAVNWTDVAQNTDIASVVKRAMKLRAPKIPGIYLRFE